MRDPDDAGRGDLFVVASGRNAQVRADLDGDGRLDLEIVVKLGGGIIDASDFLL